MLARDSFPGASVYGCLVLPLHRMTCAPLAFSCSNMLNWRRECPLLGRNSFLGRGDITWWEDNWDDDESRFLAFSLHDRCAFWIFSRISFRAWGNQGAEGLNNLKEFESCCTRQLLPARPVRAVLRVLQFRCAALTDAPPQPLVY